MKQQWSLFAKIIAIIVISLLLVSGVVFGVTYISAERMVADTFFSQNTVLVDEIKNQLEEQHQKRVSAILEYEKNSILTKYLTKEDISYQQQVEGLYEIGTVTRQYQNTENLPYEMHVLGDNGVYLSFFPESSYLNPQKLLESFYNQKANAFPRQIHYHYSETGAYRGHEDVPTIVSVKRLTNARYPEGFGTLYITETEQRFSKVYSNIIADENEFYVFSSEGQILSSNRRELVGQWNEELFDHVLTARRQQNSTVTVAKGSYLFICRYLPTHDLYLVNMMDRSEISRQFLASQKITILLLFLVTGGVILVSFFLIRGVTKPITALSHQMQEQEGNFKKIDLGSHSPEVLQLQTAYNYMVEEIDHSFDRLLEEQNQRRKLEIRALQMQINPHFLYNTLTAIKFLNWRSNYQRASQAMNALIQLLQQTLGTEEEFITLADEVDNLKQYTLINQVRYKDNIDVSYYIDENCLSAKVPKLSLQPFVENAFFHAYQKKKTGHLRIFARRLGDTLLCEIIDDGDGMELDKTETILKEGKKGNHFTGIGIQNVDQRLKLLYGENYGVTIESTLGIGTSVTVQLPLLDQ